MEGACQSNLATKIIGWRGWGHCNSMKIWEFVIPQTNPLLWLSCSSGLAPASLHSPAFPPEPCGPQGHVAHGHADPTCNGLQLGTNLSQPDDAGLYSADMGQKLGAMASILALLKAKWDVFLGGAEGSGTLETQGSNPMQINIVRSPMQISENSFSCDVAITPQPLATCGNTESSPCQSLTLRFFSFLNVLESHTHTHKMST